MMRRRYFAAATFYAAILAVPAFAAYLTGNVSVRQMTSSSPTACTYIGDFDLGALTSSAAQSGVLNLYDAASATCSGAPIYSVTLGQGLVNLNLRPHLGWAYTISAAVSGNITFFAPLSGSNGGYTSLTQI